MNMKKQVFITTLILFLVFLNGMVFIISSMRLEENLGLIEERSLGEHSYIVSALSKDIITFEKREKEISLVMTEIMFPYLYFSSDNKIKLTVYKDEKVFFTNLDEMLLPIVDFEIIESDNQYVFKEKINGQTMLYISGNLQSTQGDYMLLHSYDITEILETWSQSNYTLYFMVACLAVVLSGCLMLLLNRIFMPLTQFVEASKDIASGDYQKRLNYKGFDELSHMAESFNAMADEIEKKIAELIATAEQKQRFVDNFAHEIRTPLTTIFGYAEFIQKAKISEEDKLVATVYIMSESQRLKDLAYQLLDLATMRNNKIKKQKVDVLKLFLKIDQTMSKKAFEKNVQIEYYNQVDNLYGDSGLLECLVINLIENGLKACDDGGMIVVGVTKQEHQVTLSVEDNGKGMTEEQLLHITEAFYRVDHSRNRKEGGTGLGLSICEQIAIAHHTKLLITSQVKKGTLVQMILQLDDNFITT